MCSKIRVLAVAAILLLPILAQARERFRPDDKPTAEVIPPRPGGLPGDSRLEELIRDVYRTYETTVGKSGHDLRIRLSGFDTILRREFDDHEFLEVLPPDAGWRIAQVRTYYEAPWVRVGKVVHDRLEWRLANESEQKAAFDKMTLLVGASIADVLWMERERRNRDVAPLALTTYRVDLSFAGRQKSYRAAAVWTAGEEPDRFEMEISDRIVPELETAMVEDALPLAAPEFEDIKRPPIERERKRRHSSGLSRVAPLELACEDDLVFDGLDRGGDSDGWLTARDAIFAELLLWSDLDHDGRSDEAELLSLADAGVEAIELSYVESRRRDRHGNRFRYKARVRLRRSTTHAVDVFLLAE